MKKSGPPENYGFNLKLKEREEPASILIRRPNQNRTQDKLPGRDSRARLRQIVDKNSFEGNDPRSRSFGYQDSRAQSGYKKLNMTTEV